MEIEFDKVFKKDSLNLPSHLIKAVSSLVLEVQKCESLKSIAGIKKLKGLKLHYRVRLGDYRIGLYLDKNKVVFSRVLHRKDIYRYFP